MNPRTWLTARGVHWAVTRFGPNWLKAAAFDEQYRSGRWSFDGAAETELAAELAKRLDGGRGDLLILGCGGARVIGDLPAGSFRTVQGIDLSGEAVRLAREKWARPSVAFSQADMRAHRPAWNYEAILFSESLYYLRVGRARALLERWSQNLTPQGVFVVTIAHPARYAGHVRMIRETFRVIEDRQFAGSHRHLLSFRP